MSMSEQNSMRDLVSLGVIVAGAVIGLHLVVGEPMRHRAERAMRAVDAAQARLDEFSTPAPLGEGELATLDQLRDRASVIAQRNAQGRDQLGVYSVVTTIAGACAVQIDRMEPASGAADQQSDAVRAQAYEISAVATFPALVAFLDRLQQEAGFATVLGFSVEPQAQDGRPALRATIRTLHYAFDLGDAHSLAEDARVTAEEGTP